MQFIIKKIKNLDIKNELLKVGFDTSYLDSAVNKHEFINFKIQNLPHYCATIIKQTALSSGADAAIHRDVLTHNVEKSDLILSGTKKQLENIANSLSKQPFGLKNAGAEILKQLVAVKKNPKIMGILNITENSFSDGGKYLNFEKAIFHANKMLKDGADIIDIGAESTKPGAEPVEIETEIKRLAPIVKELKKSNVKISIDTRNAQTAVKMLDLGVDIINDVSGLEYDPKMADIIRNTGAYIVIMHSKGTPATMDNLCQYKEIGDDIFQSLKEKIEFLNIDNEKIIVDPGFGFAKNTEQNFEILKRVEEFNSLGVKTLAGASRKRFLKSLVNSSENDILDDLTMLSSFYLFENNIDIVRVHNVYKTKLALDFYNKIS